MPGCRRRVHEVSRSAARRMGDEDSARAKGNANSRIDAPKRPVQASATNDTSQTKTESGKSARSRESPIKCFKHVWMIAATFTKVKPRFLLVMLRRPSLGLASPIGGQLRWQNHPPLHISRPATQWP